MVPRAKDITARTAFLALLIAVTVFTAIPAAVLYYFGSSKEYCHKTMQLPSN
jgi:hypothetical protein